MKKILIASVFLLALNAAQSQKFGINPVSNNQIKAFPQVVGEYLYVQLPKYLLDAGPKLKIFDSNGKIMAACRLSGTVCAIYMGDMPTGAYKINVGWTGGTAQMSVCKSFVW